jgi:hypothetical protein
MHQQMAKYTSIKPKIREVTSEALGVFERLRKNPSLMASVLRAMREEMSQIQRVTPADVIEKWESDYAGWWMLDQVIDPCQTIIFSAEQAEIFSEVTKDYTDLLDYRLPFSDTFIQFTRPIPVKNINKRELGIGEGDDLVGLVLRQVVIDQEVQDAVLSGRYHFPEKSAPLGSYLNIGVAIWSDFEQSLFGWVSGSTDELLSSHVDDLLSPADPRTQINRMKIGFKWLAISCIGYINCENIYLHKEGGATEAINAKRERKGKGRLDPYYVCRIRGVQYDGNGETGTGAAHGIRYDVRGHFRRLSNGKTTWVRPHQRGLANELYVPKTYLVTKGAKDGGVSE